MDGDDALEPSLPKQEQCHDGLRRINDNEPRKVQHATKVIWMLVAIPCAILAMVAGISAVPYFANTIGGGEEHSPHAQSVNVRRNCLDSSSDAATDSSFVGSTADRITISKKDDTPQRSAADVGRSTQFNSISRSLKSVLVKYVLPVTIGLGMTWCYFYNKSSVLDSENYVIPHLPSHAPATGAPTPISDEDTDDPGASEVTGSALELPGKLPEATQETLTGLSASSVGQSLWNGLPSWKSLAPALIASLPLYQVWRWSTKKPDDAVPDEAPRRLDLDRDANSKKASRSMPHASDGDTNGEKVLVELAVPAEPSDPDNAGAPDTKLSQEDMDGVCRYFDGEITFDALPKLQQDIVRSMEPSAVSASDRGTNIKEVPAAPPAEPSNIKKLPAASATFAKPSGSDKASASGSQEDNQSGSNDEPTMFKCAMCLDDFGPKDLLKMAYLKCDHTFCLVCFRHYVDTHITEMSIPCPVPECKKEITHDNLTEFMVRKEFAKREQLLAEEACGNEKSYCPKETCKWYCIPGDAPHVTCRLCSCKYCPKCNREWTNESGLVKRTHKERSCAEWKQILSTGKTNEEREAIRKNEDYIRQKTKPCPGCHKQVNKSGDYVGDGAGCNHMTCTCGHQWCWTCRGPHLHNYPGQGQCTSSQCRGRTSVNGVRVWIH